MQKIKIGEPFTWRPAGFLGADAAHRPAPVTGRIIAINRAHRHFTVAAEINGYTVRETLKFSRPDEK